MSERRTAGVYHLLLHLRRRRVLRVGRLGTFEFPAGHYLYTGSAMNGIESRVARHRRRRKKLRWHIDYLLRAAELTEVFAVPTTRRIECTQNRWALSLPGAAIVAHGFGSSDCACPSHLVYFPGGAPEVSRIVKGGRR